MSKGGGGTSTVTQNADPWEGAQGYMHQGLYNLQQIFQHGGIRNGERVRVGETDIDPGVTAPTYYPGSTIAPMSDYTAGALLRQGNRGMNGSAVTQNAQAHMNNVLQGGFLDANNGALQSAINYATAPVQSAVDSAFSSAGRYGSGSHVDQLGRNIGEISSNMAFQNFNNERNRMMQAGALAPNLAMQDYIDFNQMGSAGSALDAYNQARLNADIERFNYGQDSDWIRTKDFLNTVMGAGGTGSTSMGQQNMTPNAFSSALSGGLGIAGIGNLLGLWGGAAAGASAGSALGAVGGPLLFSASDERLKTDIEEVGTLNNGLPVYTYHYLWDDPTTTPKRMGVMAQDALELKPEAVGLIGGGYLGVDYSRVTEDA